MKNREEGIAGGVEGKGPTQYYKLHSSTEKGIPGRSIYTYILYLYIKCALLTHTYIHVNES